MANQGKLIALHNNDVVFLAWKYDEEIEGCLGFTVRRRDAGGSVTFKALPAWVGWQGGSNQNWEPKTTDEWPVQKFSWRDFTAHPGSTYEYQVVPMVGEPSALQARNDLAVTTTDPVSLTPATDGDIEAFFNNGILSTQHISHMIPPGKSGAPNFQKLTQHIQTPSDPLRMQLAGQMVDALKSLLVRAIKEGGECYCALYELSDQELIDELIKAKQHVHIVLSTAGTNDSTNHDSRRRLHGAHVDITDRMLPSQHIGHNKFVVYCEKPGQATAVLAGSTNWTPTGLCAQSNNSVILSDPRVAGYYLDYWKRLKADTVAAGKNTNAMQSKTFRSVNNHARVSGPDTVWFSPNTAAKSKGKATPGDLAEVFAAIEGAGQAILFLEFQPGTPSVLDKIKEVEAQKPHLFVRGAATDPGAIEKFDDRHPIATELYHRTSSGEPDRVFETGVAATAINDEFGYWKKELLKSSPTAHAIIHDKIVVIDPLSENCVVVTGSHNQGFKASYANDENLLLLKGNQQLARAYATHVMDVYDHYRWRFWIQQQKEHAWTGLQTNPDWQDRYFQPASMAYQELAFWMSALPEGKAPAGHKSRKAAAGK